jgi:hypothetical protein
MCVNCNKLNYFTFEPHIAFPDSKYGYKKENIYYFEENKLEIDVVKTTTIQMEWSAVSRSISKTKISQSVLFVNNEKSLFIHGQVDDLEIGTVRV